MILTTLVAAVVLGIAAQMIAERFQIPAILFLLVFGVLLGPSGMAVFQPSSLGDVLEALIKLGVAVILFEGGLTLDPRQVLRVGGAVRNLLTVGVVITGAGCAWLAHTVAELPWPAAVLFGAIMTVTGPTVVSPLLRHMIAPKRAKTVLMTEGLMIDAIGAVLAYLVLLAIRRAGVPWRELGAELVTLAVTGLVLGFVAGALCKAVVRSRIISSELQNLFVLAVLVLTFLLAERQAHESGILASVVMGFTISASEVPDLVSLKAFKGQLSTLLISVLFVLLAGQLDILAIWDLGISGLLVLAGVIFVVRPVSVFLSVWPRQLPWKERVLVALTAPRGIVAAAVASLAARSLRSEGIAGGTELEGLVYLTILGTGFFATAMAPVLPRMLGFHRDSSRRRAVIVGANPLTELLAEQLERLGRTTVLIDRVPWRLDRFRNQGRQAMWGDARDSITYEEAGVERDSLVISATTNDELNLLVAELVREEFGVEHPVVTLQRPPEELGKVSRAWLELLGGGPVDLPKWLHRIEYDSARCLDIDAREEETRTLLRGVEREESGDVLRLLAVTDGSFTFRVDDDHIAGYERVLLLVGSDRAAELLAPVALPEASLCAPGSAAEADEAEPQSVVT